MKSRQARFLQEIFGVDVAANVKSDDVFIHIEASSLTRALSVPADAKTDF